MKEKIVRYTSETLPRITAEEAAKLLPARPKKIDTSDIPEWTEAQSSAAEHGVWRSGLRRE